MIVNGTNYDGGDYDRNYYYDNNDSGNTNGDGEGHRRSCAFLMIDSLMDSFGFIYCVIYCFVNII